MRGLGSWRAVKGGILAIYSGAMISLYNLCGVSSSFLPLVRYEICGIGLVFA